MASQIHPMTFTGWSSVATMGSVYYVAMIGLGVYQAYIKRCKLRIKEEKLELLRQRDAAAEARGTNTLISPQDEAPTDIEANAEDLTTSALARAIQPEDVV